MTREALTFEEVRTFCFFTTGFFRAIFIDCVERRLDFLVEADGDRRGSEEELWLFFSGSVHSESKISSTNYRGHFDWDLGISIVEFRLTIWKTVG